MTDIETQDIEQVEVVEHLGGGEFYGRAHTTGGDDAAVMIDAHVVLRDVMEGDTIETTAYGADTCDDLLTVIPGEPTADAWQSTLRVAAATNAR